MTTIDIICNDGSPLGVTSKTVWGEGAVWRRFWKKVKIGREDDCWEWLGCKNGNGYGSFNFQGKTVQAHRICWLFVFGEIPTLDGVDCRGTCVLHRCDNKLCVNPAHLFLGTHADNMRDMKNKGRGGTCLQHGEHNPQSKLIKSQVVAIRKLYSLRNYTQSDIAKAFGVSFQHISDIINRHRWSHI
jgi:hypothetical protein